MSDEAPRRLHPVSPFFDLIGSARQFALPAGVALVSGQWWFALPGVVLIVILCVSWARYTYQVDGDVVRINEGLLVRKKRTIAIDRIQQVDVVSKLRHRVLGVVGLHVDTASGASGAELKLDVVSKAEAERLRALFERRGVASRDASADDDAETTTASAMGEPVVKLSVGQLAIAGMTGAQTLVILGFVFSLQELADFVDFGRFRTLIPEGAESNPVAIVSGLVSVGVLWLGLAAAALILTHYDYAVTVADGEFRITRGLLDRREVGGSLARVQAIRVEQSFVRRLLGFSALRVQTAAIPGQNVSRIVIPFVADADVDRLVAVFLPGTPAAPPLPRTPRRALVLALLRRVPPVALVGVVFAIAIWPLGAVALLAVPVAFAAGLLHWRAHGFAMEANTVWARRGGLFRETLVIPAAKAQSLRQGASVLQRRVGLASLRIDVAGRGSTPRIQDAPVASLDVVVTSVVIAGARDERATRAART